MMSFLFIDLDRTLISCDTSKNEINSYMRRHGKVTLLKKIVEERLFTLLKLKNWLSNEVVEIDYNSCINESVIEYARLNPSTRKVIITASAKHSATRVRNTYFADFELVTSSENINLKGLNKLRQITKLSNGMEFSYIGDSKRDIPIFKEARKAILVVNGKSPKKKFNDIKFETIIFTKQRCPHD